jgi:uncharacterized repeat protein (TIGR02543 family)
MTATASTGFGFTGWTGSSTTNGATLKFIMASNLTFTANFADTARPTNGISSPTANQHWSNEVFTVSGKAKDNVAVANVFYSLNGSGWAPAVTANNWSNWTAQVTLVPGTNTIQAYAVDTVGNFSTTNKASLVYILSAPLTVSTNGNGTISPNYNGALLQIGANYSMTATASAGFGFTGWTGSSTTNGATLKFVMASNLTFTANFVDTARPTNGISSPTANQHWSNEVFTVSGKARDNVAVANVFYSLNGSGWAPAVTANNWTNWTAEVTLTPGTNTIQAYAMDTVGNFSTTNKASLVYILSAPLTVSTNGNGTISPNYNGALLQIGANYSMTATASAGFGFTGWTGSSTTNGATIKFLMAPDLTFTANFADTARPTNGISSPTANQHWSNEVFTVSGKARDNVAVANVFYSLNGSGWAPAVTANNWTNWTAEVTLTPGTNTIQAYAMDTVGNFSTTNKASLVYILSASLTVSTNGNGTISPNYNGALLQIGANYSMTATASAGFGFTGWTGSSTTNGATLKFVMASNLTFTANFSPIVSCTYVLSATSTNVAAGTASGSFNVTAASGCAWTATSGSSWIHTSSAGTGSGTVSYTVDANTATNSRTGTMTISGHTFTVTQAKSTGGTYSGGPIRIRSDDQFTGTNGVVSGSGTQADPYIIEGWTIDASSCDTSVWPYIKVGIIIDYTSKYFVIRNCTIENAGEYGAGISLGFLSNGRMENSVVRNSGSGISLGGCSNVVLFGNMVENCRDGISNGSYSSDGVTISNNTITGCTDMGIDFHYLANSSASGNTISNNSDGIEVFDASACTISNNIVQGNTWTGIDVDTDGFENNINIISYNDTSGNGAEGIYVTCSHNTISHNTSNGNGYMGIRLDYVALTDITASYNTVSDNTANNNGGDGLFVGSGCDYNTISNNMVNNNVMNGIEAEGDYNTISSNTAFSNNALGRYDPDGHPWYYDIMISSPLPNTNTLVGNAYGTIYIY